MIAMILKLGGIKTALMMTKKDYMSKLDIRSAYSHRDPVNNPLSGEPSRTKQEFKTEVNINEIISRMRRGINPPQWMTSNTPHYGDFSDMPTSFQEAYAIVESGEAAFRSLPLDFRRALDHNPANLADAPRELYERFGLVKKPVQTESPNGDTDWPGNQRVKGDRGLPAKAPPGAKNAVQKPADNADE